jgi:two-component system, OmpR family, response regulator TctD
MHACWTPGRNNKMKLLLVEDNAGLAQWLLNLLRRQNFVVDCVVDGDAADTALQTQLYDLVLLEVHLPHMSGMSVLARLRRRRDNVAVVMMATHGSIDDKVACFDAGADDYLVKPFDTRELLARIKALIRRQAGTNTACLACGDLHYRADTREFRHNDTPLTLRRREHSILEVLMLHQGRTVSKRMLMENVFSLEEEPSRDAIDIYIHRLRKHLAPSSAQILTVRGLGYILRARGAVLLDAMAEVSLDDASGR